MSASASDLSPPLPRHVSLPLSPLRSPATQAAAANMRDADADADVSTSTQPSLFSLASSSFPHHNHNHLNSGGDLESSDLPTFTMPCRPFGPASKVLLANGIFIVLLAFLLVISTLVVYKNIYAFEVVVAVLYIAVGGLYVNAALTYGKECHVVGTARTGGAFVVVTNRGQRYSLPLSKIRAVHHVGNTWCWQGGCCDNLFVKLKSCRIYATTFRDNVLVESEAFFKPPSALVSPVNGKELADRVREAVGLETVNLLRQIDESSSV
ncbi:hypothetical protein NFJ02_04g117970 [Pycnococcus provasolii]